MLETFKPGATQEPVKHVISTTYVNGTKTIQYSDGSEKVEPYNPRALDGGCTPIHTQPEPIVPHNKHSIGNRYTLGAWAHEVAGAFKYTPPDKPEDTTMPNSLSIVLMNQHDLDIMSSACKATAGGSEFQIHYRALIIRLKKAGKEVILTIPTSYYNFKQEVAHSSVDFHLDDVDTEAEVCRKASSDKCAELIAKVPILTGLNALKQMGVEVDIIEANSGSMHRHPGRFGFSSIDYRKDPKNPGVIYRQSKCTDFVQTDSVLYLGESTEIYTTETRIVTVEPTSTGVKGDYCRVPTFTYIVGDNIQHQTNELSDILGNAGFDDHVEVRCSINKHARYGLILDIVHEFASSKFQADTSNVKAERITNRTITYGVHYGKRGKYGFSYGAWDEMDDPSMYDWDDGYTTSKRRGKSAIKADNTPVIVDDTEPTKPATTQQVASHSYNTHEKAKGNLGIFSKLTARRL